MKAAETPLRWTLWLPPFIAGLALRLYRLPEQILTGDELHAIEAALEWPAAEILRNWTYYGADYGIPFGLLYRAAIESGAQPGEFFFRLPSLVAGLVALWLVPRWLAPRIGTRAATWLAWLIALSPLLVIYSRIARGYMPVALIGFIAVFAFDRWQRERTARDACVYVLCAGFASWLHLPAAPYVLAPLAYTLLRIALAWQERRGELPALIGLGAAAGAAILAVLLPALASLTALTELHGGGGLPSALTWLEVVRLHSGSTWRAVSVAVVALTLRGVWLLWQRDRDLALYWLSLPALLVLGLIVLGPDQLENPIVINRYLIVALPLGLAFTALGLSEPWPGADASSPARAAGVALLLLLFASGPFARSEYRSSSFLCASTFVIYTGPGNRIPLEQAPDYYQQLPGQGEDGAILEYPWVNITNHAFDAYQKHHERPLVAGLLKRDARIATRNESGPEPADFLASQASLLIVHEDLRREAARVLSTDPHHWERLHILAPVWKRLALAGPQMRERLTREWGAPDHRGSEVSAWDLARVRSERASSAAEQ